ncbi:hypothetical protein Emag_007510 [Eimeria magna]
MPQQQQQQQQQQQKCSNQQRLYGLSFTAAANVASLTRRLCLSRAAVAAAVAVIAAAVECSGSRGSI